MLGLLFFVGCLALSVYSYDVADCRVCPSPTAQHPYTASKVHGSTGCERFGKTFKEGERYHKNHLWYVCENGYLHCKGCYYEEGKDLNVGETYVDHKTNTSFRCYGGDNSVQYREITCGLMGFNADNTECNTHYVPPAPKTLDLGCHECVPKPTKTLPLPVHTKSYTPIEHPKALPPNGGFKVENNGYDSGSSASGGHASGGHASGGHASGGSSSGGYKLQNNGYEQGESQQGGSKSGAYKTTTYNLPTKKCTKNGQFFEEGEIYRNNHLWYKCEKGVVVVKGCYTNNNKDLLPGQNYVDHEAKSILICQQLGPKIGYSLKLCTGTGFNSALTDCKGTARESDHTYNEVAHHKVYVTKNSDGEHKVDEEKQMHVDCNCYN